MGISAAKGRNWKVEDLFRFSLDKQLSLDKQWIKYIIRTVVL